MQLYESGLSDLIGLSDIAEIDFLPEELEKEDGLTESSLSQSESDSERIRS